MAMLFGSASVWMWGMMLSLSDVRESDEVSAVPQCYRAGERLEWGRRSLFGDLDPPQTFALRADEILGNERQTVWRSGRALQA
jgi:hypothetical protein